MCGICKWACNVTVDVLMVLALLTLDLGELDVHDIA